MKTLETRKRAFVGLCILTRMWISPHPARNKWAFFRLFNLPLPPLVYSVNKLKFIFLHSFNVALTSIWFVNVAFARHHSSYICTCSIFISLILLDTLENVYTFIYTTTRTCGLSILCSGVMCVVALLLKLCDLNSDWHCKCCGWACHLPFYNVNIFYDTY